MKDSVKRLSACLLLAGAAGVGVWLVLPQSGPVPATRSVSPSLERSSESALSVVESPSASRDSVSVEQGAAAGADELTTRRSVRNPAFPRQSTEFSTPAETDEFENTSPGHDRIGHELDDSNAVIGRPFPMSESVKSSCPREIAMRSSCIEVLDFLDQMAEEPRDPHWATVMEARLRQWILRSGDWTIRSIECRTSACAVEVSSLYGPLLGFRYGDPPHGALFNWIGLIGYETHPSSARVTVTLKTFKRRYTN